MQWFNYAHMTEFGEVRLQAGPEDIMQDAVVSFLNS